MKRARVFDVDRQTPIDINLEAITLVEPLVDAKMESSLVRVYMATGPAPTVWVGDYEPSRRSADSLDLFWMMVEESAND